MLREGEPEDGNPAWGSALMPFAFPWGQPHLSLPYNYVAVFSLLQDPEHHVSFQLVKHLWENQEPERLTCSIF